MSDKKEIKSRQKEKAPIDEATLLARQIVLKKILLTVVAILGALIILFAVIIIVDNKTSKAKLLENSDEEISWLYDIAFGDTITYEDVQDYDFTCYVSSNKDEFKTTKAIKGKDAVFLYSLLQINQWKSAKSNKNGAGEDIICLYFCYGKEKDSNAFQQVYIGDNNDVVYSLTAQSMGMNVAVLPDGVYDTIEKFVAGINE